MGAGAPHLPLDTSHQDSLSGVRWRPLCGLLPGAEPSLLVKLARNGDVTGRVSVSICWVTFQYDTWLCLHVESHINANIPCTVPSF